MSLKRDLKFIGHTIIPVYDLRELPKIDNVIYRTEIPELKWIEALTFKIGDWRDIFRSTYIRWALSINGLHVASEKYKEPAWKQAKSFFVTSLRPNLKTKANERIKLVEWDGDTASDAHIQTANMLATYGIIDLYSCFEEFVFDMYRTYLYYNPGNFIIGPENRALRKLYRNKEAEPDKWESAWNDRLDAWQRKKIYDGLDTVFLSFLNTAQLENPKSYKITTIETWAESLRLIAILRNALIHGEKNVPKELAEISQKGHGLGFNLQENSPLKLETLHLMAVEAFTDQLLDALNLSIIEKAEREYPKYNK